MEFVLLFSLMFSIAWFGFVLLLINDCVLLLIHDWRLAMQVNIHQSFFSQSFRAAFLPNFLPYGINLSRSHMIENIGNQGNSHKYYYYYYELLYSTTE